jgi:hypothetical protein
LPIAAPVVVMLAGNACVFDTEVLTSRPHGPGGIIRKR